MQNAAARRRFVLADQERRLGRRRRRADAVVLRHVRLGFERLVGGGQHGVDEGAVLVVAPGDFALAAAIHHAGPRHEEVLEAVAGGDAGDVIAAAFQAQLHGVVQGEAVRVVDRNQQRRRFGLRLGGRRRRPQRRDRQQRAYQKGCVEPHRCSSDKFDSRRIIQDSGRSPAPPRPQLPATASNRKPAPARSNVPQDGAAK